MTYEMMVVLTDEFNNADLKVWVFKFGKILKRLNANDISLMFRGKRKLNYKIKNRNRGHFIQVNFSILPDYVKQLINDLNQDSRVLRFLIFKISQK